MILLWIIRDQKKTEAQANAEGWIPACSLSDRLCAYFFGIIIPIIVGCVIGYFGS